MITDLGVRKKLTTTQQVYWPCWPHRRQAASHRIDVAQDLAPDTGLWEAALLAMAV